ncbi:MAG: hypothetical protein MJE77_07115 [Proteobacteria bacterium]|nr:hypothetical protein [Pseudomonadota bacterium]
MAGRTSVDASSRVYRGAAGRTCTVQIHYTCPCGTRITAEIYRSIDVSAEPELARRLCNPEPDDPLGPINTVNCPTSDAPVPIDMPVVYHDPDRALFVLVMSQSARHRELEERVTLLQELARDPAPVPSYVIDFDVVFGTDALNQLIAQKDAEKAREQAHAELENEVIGLRAELADRDEMAREVAELRDKVERQDDELERRRGELERQRIEMEAREADSNRELARQRDELEQGRTELARQRDELAQGRAELAGQQDELAQGRAELARQQDELAQGRAELARQQDELAQGRAELAGQQDELAQGQAELAGQQDELAQGQAELAGQQDELAQGQAELAGQQDELAQGQAELARNWDELEQTQTELTQHWDELEQAQRELTQHWDELEQAQAELVQQRDDVEQVRAELAGQRDELAQARTELVQHGDAVQQDGEQYSGDVDERGEVAGQWEELEQEQGELAQEWDELSQEPKAPGELAEEWEELEQEQGELAEEWEELEQARGRHEVAQGWEEFEQAQEHGEEPERQQTADETRAETVPTGAVDQISTPNGSEHGMAASPAGSPDADKAPGPPASLANEPPDWPEGSNSSWSEPVDQAPQPSGQSGQDDAVPHAVPEPADDPQSALERALATTHTLLAKAAPEDEVRIAGQPVSALRGNSAAHSLPGRQDVSSKIWLRTEQSSEKLRAATVREPVTELGMGDVAVESDHQPGAQKDVDPAVERWQASGQSTFKTVDSSRRVRIGVSVTAGVIEMLRRGSVEIRVQLHRFPSYPLVNLAVGSPSALRGEPDCEPPVDVLFDVSGTDREVLLALKQTFHLTLEVRDTNYSPVYEREVTADLSDNVSSVLAAADRHLIEIIPSERSYDRAIAAFSDPAYDAYGWTHPERNEFREDKLVKGSTGQEVRRALAIADRFSSSKREDYLFFIRSYPITLWRQQRRRVLERAIVFGIWLGSRLAQIAVSEGLSRSRKYLIKTIRRNFAVFVDGADENDLDSDAIDDNWSALDKEAAALGIPTEIEPGEEITMVGVNPVDGIASDMARSEAIDSGHRAAVSGIIRETSSAIPMRHFAAHSAVDELIERLADPGSRVDAAVELARRAERRAIAPVMAALEQMDRAASVRVLGAIANFGDAVTPELKRGLKNGKPYIRQGCALAMAVLNSEPAIEALGDELVAEPTVLWKEMARAFGTAGPNAIMTLVSRLSRLDPGQRERVAWALSHIALSGGLRQVEQLAAGRDQVAAGVAGRALELRDSIQREHAEVRGPDTPVDQTVNRAFSREFFRAVEKSRPGVEAMEPENKRPGPGSSDGSESSSPALELDEADLLEAIDLEEVADGEFDDEGAEVLDESDLLPT